MSDERIPFESDRINQIRGLRVLAREENPPNLVGYADAEGATRGVTGDEIAPYHHALARASSDGTTGVETVDDGEAQRILTDESGRLWSLPLGVASETGEAAADASEGDPMRILTDLDGQVWVRRSPMTTEEELIVDAQEPQGGLEFVSAIDVAAWNKITLFLEYTPDADGETASVMGYAANSALAPSDDTDSYPLTVLGTASASDEISERTMYRDDYVFPALTPAETIRNIIEFDVSGFRWFMFVYGRATGEPGGTLSASYSLSM